MKDQIMNAVNSVILTFLFRGIRVLYRKDSRVRKEIEGWEAGQTLKVVCGPSGPVLAIKKHEKKGIVRIPAERKAAITMNFKSAEGAFSVMTGMISISEAYAEHKFTLLGDIYRSMSFVRVVELTEAYLFPAFWAKRILKELPDKELNTLAVYAYALLDNKN